MWDFLNETGLQIFFELYRNTFEYTAGEKRRKRPHREQRFTQSNRLHAQHTLPSLSHQIHRDGASSSAMQFALRTRLAKNTTAMPQ